MLLKTVGLSPHAIFFALMLGASSSIMTPIGYQTNQIVHSLGAYRFSDWLRVGVPLQLACCMYATWLICTFY